VVNEQGVQIQRGEKGVQTGGKRKTGKKGGGKMATGPPKKGKKIGSLGLLRARGGGKLGGHNTDDTVRGKAGREIPDMVARLENFQPNDQNSKKGLGLQKK